MRRHGPLLLLLLAAATSCAHTAGKPDGVTWPLPCALLREAPATPAPSAATRPSPPRPHRAPAPPPLLIRGATLWTATGQAPARGDILVERGRIAAVGTGLAAPAGARVVDGRGLHVTPGMIDPHSHMGVYPAPALRAHGDGNEMVKPTTPEVRAADALWPQDPSLPRALAAGVTLVHIIPGSGNLIGGQGIVARTLPGRAAAALRFRAAPRTMKMACGENPKRVYGRKGGPMTRMGSVARMRAALEAAKRYRDDWRRYRRKRALWLEGLRRRCEGAERPPRSAKPDEVQPPKPPARDLGLEALVGVLEGRVKVHWHCYRADEMLNLMRLARRHGFTVQAFHHAVEAYKIRDALARAGTAAVSWVNWWGFKAEAYDAIPENVALVASAGATASLHSDSALVLQRYNQEGALAYFRGLQMGLELPPDAGVAFVTREPAKVLGVARLVGTLEAGKLADLVLWDRSPLSVYARVKAVYVQGREVYRRGGQDGHGPRPSDFELGLVPRPAPLKPPADWTPPPLGEPLPAAPAGGPAIAIVNAEVHTVAGAPIAGGTVIVRGGRVVAVGAGLAAPAGARVIDAGGGPVTPGLVAAESTIGLVEVDLEPSARDDRAAGPRPHGDVFATLRIGEAFNPRSATVGVSRIEGITTALLRPMGFLIAGQGAAAALDGSPPPLPPRATAMHAFLSRYGPRQHAGSRAATVARLGQLLRDARLLARVRSRVEARRFRDLSAPVDQLAALIPVAEGRLPLVVHVHRAVEIRALLALAREARIRLVLSGAGEAWTVAREVAAARVPVLLEVDANLPASFDRLAGRYDAAARLHRAGVKLVISAAGQAHNARVIRQLAGIAVAWGLPHEAALAALTRNPAEVFGLAGRGVIAPGARADLVVWSGDPFELRTRVRHLVIGGRELPLTSRQTLLRERYRGVTPPR